MELNEITSTIIGAAIEVHRTLGPGLLESIYQKCLAAELSDRGLKFEAEKPVPVRYKHHTFDSELKYDFLVEGQVVVETKTVEKLLPIHQAQLMSYMKLLHCKLGLLINFKVCVLKDGIKRVIL